MIRPLVQVERAHKEYPSKKAGSLIASSLQTIRSSRHIKRHIVVQWRRVKIN